jgi:hypothetical protein
MPLVVKPNTRRMRYMRDSPSETTVGERGVVRRIRWERVILVAGLVGIAVVGLIVLVTH